MIKKFDFLWLSGLFTIIFILLYPDTHEVFISATQNHPYLMGFVKVGILASMGELLGLRITAGGFKKPVGFIHRFIVWGFLGMVFVLAFDLFAIGTAAMVEKGLLPSIAGESFGSKLLTAFFTSSLINLIFAPTFMSFHRVTDTYIELGNGKFASILKVKLKDVLNEIDWNSFISFVVVKTIPFFWIPAHTITFMLPAEYRVLMAAMLSIALGGILALAKKKKTN